MKTYSLAISAVALITTAASAQTPDDWDLVVRPDPPATMASVSFEGGATLAVSCAAGKLDVVVAGSPAGASASRDVTVTMPGVDAEQQKWIAQPGAAIMSPPEPARMARMLRSGGALNLLIAPESVGARPARMTLDYPASPAAIDRVLEACGEPLASDIDGVPRAPADGVSWDRSLDVEFPRRALDRGITVGAAELACLVHPDGTKERCWIERDAPPGAGFGEAALRAAERARFGPSPTAPEGSLVLLRFSVRLDGQ